jgi:hypothetical protein
MGGHHSAKMGKDEWLTPPWLLSKLPEFDLDPCAPIVRPWDTAKNHFTIEDDGLNQEWFGKVFLNPPYGREAAKWSARGATQDTIALIFARTETAMFHKYVWGMASAIFFFKSRLWFHHVDGKKASANAGAPSVLVGYGEWAKEQLRVVDLEGVYIEDWL